MSFPKKGKSFPKKGKSFPKRGGDGSSDFSLDDHAFAMKIASALTSLQVGRAQPSHSYSEMLAAARVQFVRASM